MKHRAEHVFLLLNGCKPNCETGRLSKRNVTAVSMTFAGFPKSYFFINLPDNRGIFLTLPILQFVIGQTKMAAGKKNHTVFFEDASPKLATFTAIMAAWRTAVSFDKQTQGFSV